MYDGDGYDDGDDDETFDEDYEENIDKANNLYKELVMITTMMTPMAIIIIIMLLTNNSPQTPVSNFFFCFDQHQFGERKINLQQTISHI